MATDRETLETLQGLLKPLHGEMTKLTALYENLHRRVLDEQRWRQDALAAAMADLQRRIGDLELLVNKLLGDRDFNAVPESRVIPRGTLQHTCEHGVHRSILCPDCVNDGEDRNRHHYDGFMTQAEQEEATREAETGFSSEFVRQLEEEQALAREAELRDGY